MNYILNSLARPETFNLRELFDLFDNLVFRLLFNHINCNINGKFFLDGFIHFIWLDFLAFKRMLINLDINQILIVSSLQLLACKNLIFL